MSYYRLRLQEHLNSGFPEKASDHKFIDQRSSWAANAYEGAFSSGNAIEQCNEIANYILFEGLHFSRFDTIFRWSAMSSIPNGRRGTSTICPEMFRVCEPVFAKYKLTDDFAYGYEFDVLYTEITGTIAIWITENGLQ
ncbi:DUF1896 domain-containing protein [Chryseobacterium arthrosphaerae]|uniref:DUF1896 domain-containing protein n=1 Tax=Chryseobacterium arthrosphaerae TaxID=651561 RepID=A0A432DSQ1_9FLAO|nr:DUF1896 domain-containing protein [Chryseobacterium arthrosphaerae]